jgi:hypothetical protein
VAGLIADAILYCVILYLSRGSEILNMILDMRLVWAVLAGTVLAGILICVISTLLVVNRVAFTSRDDLYY